MSRLSRSESMYSLGICYYHTERQQEQKAQTHASVSEILAVKRGSSVKMDHWVSELMTEQTTRHQSTKSVRGSCERAAAARGNLSTQSKWAGRWENNEASGHTLGIHCKPSSRAVLSSASGVGSGPRAGESSERSAAFGAGLRLGSSGEFGVDFALAARHLRER